MPQVSLSRAVMQSSTDHANVVFCNVADAYTVTWEKGVTCYFTVDPSILPGIRHVVGIFPVDWKSTKECIVCDWSPMPRDYQPDRSLDNSLTFSGESLRPHADKFTSTLFQFCYIDGTDSVQGSSISFRLVFSPPPPQPVEESDGMTASGYQEPLGFEEDDFVEIEEEDGEIVIIKSRSGYLQDELKKLESAAKVRDTEFEREKDALQRQLDDLRTEVVKLRSEKESLHGLMMDSERQQSARLTDLQQKYSTAQANLQQARQDLCCHASALQRIDPSHPPSSDACRRGDAVAPAAGAADADTEPCCFADSAHSHENQDATGAESAACHHSNGHHDDQPSSSQHTLPAPGSPSSAVGRVAESSPTGIVTRDYLNRSVFRFPSLREVGLNMMCHLKQSMDQFAGGTDDGYDLEPPSVTRPMFAAFDRSPDELAYSHEDQSPGVVLPSTSPSTSSAASAVSNIQCPFCYLNLYAGRRPLQEQLVDHIVSSSCLRDRQ